MAETDWNLVALMREKVITAAELDEEREMR